MDFTRKSLKVLVPALAIALVGAAGTAQGQAVKNPDTLTILATGDPETLDPAQANDTAAAGVLLWHVYETLIFFNGVRTDQYVPMLATEVPSLANGGISQDGRTYTFKIRQGVKFHDGSIMTPEDVKYSLMRLMLTDPEAGPAWIYLTSILGFETRSTRDATGQLLPDIWDRANRAIQVMGNSVVINLKEPYAPFLNITAGSSIVMSKKFVLANGGWDGTRATLAKYNNPKNPEDLALFDRASGTGPFRLERWDRATSTVVLVRNEDYWQTPAKLRRVIINKVEEFAPRRLALQNGDADIIWVDRGNQPAVTDLPGVRIVDALPRLANSPALLMTLHINAEGNPDIGSGKLDGNGIPPDFFADVHVRRAFAHLFDRQAFITQALRGKGRVANGPIPFGMLGYNPKGEWYEVSKEKAIAEFHGAHDGQVWERGFKFTLLFNTGNLNRQTAAQMVKEAAESLNPKFRIDVRGVTWSSYLGLYRTKKLPMFVLGWVADYADPDDFVVPFLHSTGSLAKVQGYTNIEADRLIEAAAKETDQKKRQRMYFRLQEIAFEDVPTIYIVYRTDFVTMRSWVKGWYSNPIFPSVSGYFYTMWKGQ